MSGLAGFLSQEEASDAGPFLLETGVSLSFLNV